MTNTAHTPTPWDVYLGSTVVANVRHAGMHGALQDEVARCSREANAAHIVRCVNAHTMLVELLREALARLDPDERDADLCERITMVLAAASSSQDVCTHNKSAEEECQDCERELAPYMKEIARAALAKGG